MKMKFQCFLLLIILNVCVSENDDKCHHKENKYSAEKNILTQEEMFKRGHLKPFGSHRPSIPVETLKHMISPQDFYMDYVAKHVPVVFKGVTETWPAYHLWTDDYLLKKYGDTQFHMETKDDDKNNPPPDRKLKHFLENYNKSNLYLVDEVTPAMREDVHLPLCLRCEEIDKFFFVSYYWHSNGGTMSTVHIDTDENLLCVIHGHKKVIMVSPVYTHDLYGDDTRQLGVLDVNSSSVDLKKYPRVMNIKHYEAQVNEGDCVYIPQMWWHQVYSRQERQQAIAMWWKSKPFWKRVAEGDEKSGEISKENQKKHSYADALVDYEHWVQNVSASLPRLRCKEQQVKMSNYVWETDKEEGAPRTLGDGGVIEEEIFEQYVVKTYAEVQEKLKQAGDEKKLRSPCDFDYSNPNSPCHLQMDDEDDARFVRHVMDYCQRYEDRGCVINKPQLLNKMYQDDFQHMAFNMKSKFKR